MHLLFVVPRFAGPGQYYSYPIGLASVYAAVKRHGIAVSCLNLCHEASTDTRALLEREFARQPVDMVCSGGMCAHWTMIHEIFTRAKEIRPEIVTVAGGPIVTAEPEVALGDIPMDYGVLGEGEYALIELVETLEKGGSAESVAGLVFKGPDGKMVKTGVRPEIPNLDALPMPEYEDFGFQHLMRNMKYAQQCTYLESLGDVRFVEVTGSRSCPFSCTFCYHPLGKKYRQRTLDHIFQEIDYLTRTYGVNFIQFSDELFSVDEKRILAFVERIKPYGIRWAVQFRVSDVKPDLLRKMVDAGLALIFFGIESLSDPILKSMKKHITRAQIIKALETARQVGVLAVGNIILGDPADTRETIEESITWWKNNPVYNVSLNFILAVPDAPLYRLALERGIIQDRLAHVKNLPLLNMCRLTDEEYYQQVMKVRWWNLMQTHARPGTLLATRPTEETHCGRRFYELELRCPFCGKDQTHKKFLAGSAPNLKVVCIHCFASFKIRQGKAFPGDYSVAATAWFVLAKAGEAYAMRFSLFRKYFELIKQKLRWLKR